MALKNRNQIVANVINVINNGSVQIAQSEKLLNDCCAALGKAPKKTTEKTSTGLKETVINSIAWKALPQSLLSENEKELCMFIRDMEPFAVAHEAGLVKSIDLTALGQKRIEAYLL